MINRDWQNIFGRPPEDFLRQVDRALSGLEEEKEMKKRYKASTVVLLAVLVTGAAVAAGLGFIDRINESGDYRVSEAAEELIEKDLGGMENELFSVVIEEALYDGQSAILQILLTPAEPDRYALYHADYPMPDELQENFIFDAQEGQDARMPTACRDGRTPLLYDVGVNQVRGDEMAWDNRPDDLSAPQYHEDGSVRLLIGGTADTPILKNSIYFAVTCRWGVPGEYEYTGYQSEGAPYLPRFQDIRLGIEFSGRRELFLLEPAGEAENGGMEFVGGTIGYTAVGGYYDIEYISGGREAWKDEFAWEADGQRLFVSQADIHGAPEEGTETVRRQGMIERTEEIPGTLTLIVTDRETRTETARFELKMIPAEEPGG